MDVQFYPDLTTLVINIIKHIDEHGDFIIIDNLVKKLTFRWKCTKTEKQWNINLSKVKSSDIWDDTNPLSPHFERILREHVKAEDWQKLVIRDDCIKRIVRLMTFW